MQRVVATSQGLITFDYEPDRRLGPSHFGLAVTVTVHDADGWESKSQTWMQDRADSSLGEHLAAFADLPPDEADALATQIQATWLDEWRARGGEEAERDLQRFANRFLAGVALVIALAIAGVVLLVWFLLT